MVAQDEWGGVNQYFVHVFNYRVFSHGSLRSQRWTLALLKDRLVVFFLYTNASRYSSQVMG